MKSFKQTFTVTLPEKQGFMDLTDDVMECVRRANIKTGICTVSSLHTTASVITSTRDEKTLDDYLKFYDKLTTLAEENLRPALKSQLAGRGVTLGLIDGEVTLGYTQFVVYLDFDGGREKLIEINIIGE